MSISYEIELWAVLKISNMRHCEGGANALWAFEPARVYVTEAISLIKEKIASFLAMTD